MFKVKKPFYKFSREKLTYVKVNRSLLDNIMVGFKWIFITLAVAISFNLVFSFFFDTPVEKNIRRENNLLENEYEKLHKKYQRAFFVLDDIKDRDKNIYKAIFETTPYNDKSKILAKKRIEKQSEKTNEELILETSRKISEFELRISEHLRFIDYILRKANNRKESLTNIPAIQPIKNKNLTKLGAGYGWKIHPIYKIKKFHKGVDFTATKGSKVYATGDGTVEKVKKSARGYGNSITINHGNGYKTIYAHLDKVKKWRGNKIKRGDIIGTVGSSGVSLAPHLHYEIIKDDRNVNPAHYFFLDLTPDEYEKIIEIANNSGQSFD